MFWAGESLEDVVVQHRRAYVRFHEFLFFFSSTALSYFRFVLNDLKNKKWTLG